MALCLIYREGLSPVLAVILVICFGNALYQAAGFARRVSDRYHQVLHLPVVLGIIAIIFIVLTPPRSAGPSSGRPQSAIRPAHIQSHHDHDRFTLEIRGKSVVIMEGMRP